MYASTHLVFRRFFPVIEYLLINRNVYKDFDVIQLLYVYNILMLERKYFHYSHQLLVGCVLLNSTLTKPRLPPPLQFPALLSRCLIRFCFRWICFLLHSFIDFKFHVWYSFFYTIFRFFYWIYPINATILICYSSYHTTSHHTSHHHRPS